MKWTFQSPFYSEEPKALIASNFSQVAEIEIHPVCPMLSLQHLLVSKCQKNVLLGCISFLFKSVIWRHNAVPVMLPLMKITWGPTYEISIIDLSTSFRFSLLMADPHALRVELI